MAPNGSAPSGTDSGPGRHLVTVVLRLRLGRGVRRGGVGVRYKPGGGLCDRPIRFGQQTRTARDKVPATPRRILAGGTAAAAALGQWCRWPVPVPW